MVSKALVLFPLLLLASGPAAAQQPAPGHVDPVPILRAAAKAMGTDKLNCITISGTGYAGKVGQNVTQDTDWPRGEPLANYTRTIDYAAKSSIEQFDRKPGMARDDRSSCRQNLRQIARRCRLAGGVHRGCRCSEE